MTVTWTSGYDINEAVPFVKWGSKGKQLSNSPAGTLTFGHNSMCGKLNSTCSLTCMKLILLLWNLIIKASPLV